jgi:peptide/nickel transport system permease protein
VLRYIVRRLLAVIPVLFGVSVIVFSFVHLLPGDPARAILGERATPELVAQLHESLGLGRPLWDQYLEYITQLIHGNLGVSIYSNVPVAQEFFSRFPATLELAVGALVFGVGLGIPLGYHAACHSGGWTDGMVTFLSLAGVAIPIFVLGPTLQYVFGARLHMLPTSGQIDPRILFTRQTNFVLVDAFFQRRPDAVFSALQHLMLPAITLGMTPFAMIARITRTSVQEVANEDYVRTARAKGLGPNRVSARHVMRNAWLPVLTILGLQIGVLLAGAVIAETVFAWNGVGSLVVSAIFDRDYFVIQSAILIFALIFLLTNLVVDIGYAFLDPRLRYQ